MKESRTRQYELTSEDITQAVKDYIKKHKRVEVNDIEFQIVENKALNDDGTPTPIIFVQDHRLTGCTCTYNEPDKVNE